MIKLVVIGKCWDPEGSDELKFGCQALQRQLPTSAAVVHTQAENFEDYTRMAGEVDWFK